MKKGLFIVIGLLAVIIIYLAVSPVYVRNALLYQKVGIEDYNIFENREISTGNTISWSISKSYNKKQIPDSLTNKFDQYKPVAFIVVQEDSILHEEYWEGYGTDSYSNSFSMAKSIVSLLIGIAIDEGKIQSLQQPVVEIIPEFGHFEDNERLRIIDLLTMSSGLNWDESYGSLYSETTKAYYGDDIYNQIINLKVIEKPGIEFKYLSGNTQLLALVLSKATQTTLSNYAAKKLWQPIGAEHTALWSVDNKEGYEKAYCCFNSNARDFAKIGQLVLHNGKVDSNQVVSNNYIEKATQAASFIKDESGNPLTFYGLQWWILEYKGFKIPYARGILGQYIFVLPEKNAVVVRLGHKRDEQKLNHHPLDTYLYIDAALSILNN